MKEESDLLVIGEKRKPVVMEKALYFFYLFEKKIRTLDNVICGNADIYKHSFTFQEYQHVQSF